MTQSDTILSIVSDQLADAEDQDSKIELPTPSRVRPVARAVLRERFRTEDGKSQTLRRWRGKWWEWSGPSWTQLDEEALRNELYDVLENAYYKDGDDHVDWNPTRQKITNIVDALAGLCVIPETVEAPAWLSGEHEHQAGDYIAMDNGLFHVPTRQLLPFAPELFNTNHLPFSYDPNAVCPNWVSFLQQILAHDGAAGDALQEFAGYLSSGRTDLQKALMIIGPTRSGKGTILQVLTGLIGAANTAAVTLSGLMGDFGLSNLLGKSLATIGDARITPHGTSSLVERLLSITGEDLMGVNVKHEPIQTVKLPSRIVMASNELPRLGDASAALVGRFIIIRLDRSFLGAEDETLKPRLLAELPGIFNWALDGLDALAKQRRFTEPATMADAAEDMRSLASPVREFGLDTYEFTGAPDDWVYLKEAHADYKLWCNQREQSPVAQIRFAEELRAAFQVQTPNTYLDPVNRTNKARIVRGVKKLPGVF